MSQYDEKMRAHRAVAEAEAMSRRDEAVAQIHASRGITDSDVIERVTGDTRIDEAQERYRTAGRDLSGSTAGLSDSRGNHAANVDVGLAGGTGVEASNSQTGGSQEPAENGDNAGDVNPQSAGVNIPDNWETLSFRERSNLASQLTVSGRQARNGDEANEIINAELERRKLG